MLASKAVELLSALDPNDEVWVSYMTKGDVQEAFSNAEMVDENDNLIETDNLVTNDVIEQIATSLDNDDYLWERFNENFNDTCREVLISLLAEKKEAETDTELWDKEITNESK
jgi:plasmid maintenance system antidote protein VapI